MSTKLTKSFSYGEHTVRIETGEVARQASGAVLVDMADTVVIVTVVAAKKPTEGIDMLPLTVDYMERTYAAGRIPGGYFRREGRPSENEILVSRLIDRPIRPLFADGFRHEVQIIATVHSLNPEVNPDIPAMIGASAALALAGVPFNGPIAAARVGYIDGQYILNPTYSQTSQSQLDLVVAGTEHGVLMVESGARELTEEVMLGAVEFGHNQIQAAIQAIKALQAEVNPPLIKWSPAEESPVLAQVVASEEQSLRQAYQIAEKTARHAEIDRIYEEAVTKVQTQQPEITSRMIEDHLAKLEEKVVRSQILNEKRRIDGRGMADIRPITVKTSFLPRVHGSALFTRGETQALVVSTLGSTRDAQNIDALRGELVDYFMLHYNFPPFSVGETGRVGSPRRREIGHGHLAKRAVIPLLPDQNQFPYVLRVVSEILESNGSSSMATVCGASLALMDAGVPLRAPVAGIAMGLIQEGNQTAVLSDILGDEDHLGDMDFKVAGTEKGITALQMDLKIDRINFALMGQALKQAREGRLHILNIMNSECAAPRSDLSKYAPRIYTMTIPTERIKDVIGKGGSVIRSIIEESGATIDIEDSGIVKIAAVDESAAEIAMKRIRELTAEVEVGQTYHGKVVKLADFGAFVSILPGKEGLVHISQISDEHVANVSDKLSEGQEVTVKVMAIDRQGRVRLTMREFSEQSEE